MLDVERGATTADRDGYFEIVLPRPHRRVPVPRYRMPDVPKLSAGYFAAPGMDLIDLFIGSEGTLGVITEVTLRVLPARPAVCLAFVPFDDRGAALAFVRAAARRGARDLAHRATRAASTCRPSSTWTRACLALLREDGADRAHGVAIPGRRGDGAARHARAAAGHDRRRRRSTRSAARASRGAPDTPLVRFCRVLDEAGVLDASRSPCRAIARARRSCWRCARRCRRASTRASAARSSDVDPRIAKTAADMIVPFERLEELLTIYDEEFARRGLDAAVWGHISDGNLHPNVIPRSMADVESGKAAILAFGREVIRLGGSPLAEHGVGRQPGQAAAAGGAVRREGIDEMRAVKRALDPEWKLAPGVLFPKAA